MDGREIGQSNLRRHIRGHVFIDDKQRERAVGAMNGISGKQERVAAGIEHRISGPRKIVKQFFCVISGIDIARPAQNPIITHRPPAVDRGIKIAVRFRLAVLEIPPDK